MNSIWQADIILLLVLVSTLLIFVTSKLRISLYILVPLIGIGISFFELESSRYPEVIATTFAIVSFLLILSGYQHKQTLSELTFSDFWKILIMKIGQILLSLIFMFTIFPIFAVPQYLSLILSVLLSVSFSGVFLNPAKQPLQVIAAFDGIMIFPITLFIKRMLVGGTEGVVIVVVLSILVTAVLVLLRYGLNKYRSENLYLNILIVCAGIVGAFILGRNFLFIAFLVGSVVNLDLVLKSEEVIHQINTLIYVVFGLMVALVINTSLVNPLLVLAITAITISVKPLSFLVFSVLTRQPFDSSFTSTIYFGRVGIIAVILMLYVSDLDRSAESAYLLNNVIVAFLVGEITGQIIISKESQLKDILERIIRSLAPNLHRDLYIKNNIRKISN